MYNSVTLYEMGTVMQWAVVVVATVLGLMVGSAINAFVWRLHKGKSWVRGRSVCTHCGHTLGAADLVPVASWVALQGRCRYCGKRIEDSPWVEIVTAALFGLSAWVLAPSGFSGWLQLGLWLAALVLLVVLAVYDARWLILPDRVVVPLIVLALVFAAVMAAATGSWQVLVGALEAAVLAGGAFFALVFFSRGRAMGGGDIKLAAAMGLLLGLKGTGVAMLVAFNVAAVAGLTLIALRKRGRKDQIPFGPFLVLGAVVAYLYGRALVEWYLRVNGLG